MYKCLQTLASVYKGLNTDKALSGGTFLSRQPKAPTADRNKKPPVNRHHY
jgi:hypothetical protein